VRLTGRGDGAIRATHAKTMELTPDPSITARATCVVAVDVRPQRGEPLPAGPVTITISAGEQSFDFDAHANSSWRSDGPAVIRRSALALPGTAATCATASSADLPRELVAALQAPGTQVDVEMRPRRGLSALVLFAAGDAMAPDPRLAAELAVADAVVAEDQGARAAIALAGADVELLDPRSSAALPHGRVLVVAAADLPGATLDPAQLDGRPGEAVGLPARLAVAAASASRAPLTFAPHGTDAKAALRAAPTGHRLVVATPPDGLATLRADVADLRGDAPVVIAQQYAQPVRLQPGEPAVTAGQGVVHVCVEPPVESGDALDPGVLAAIRALLADGVATRTAARALAELTGWPRRRAYDAVLHVERPD
jgi:hypothetical protein